jgi:hypothetical protein
MPLSAEGGSVSVPDGDDTRDVVCADFDGDGDLDLFFLNRYIEDGGGTPQKVRSRLYLNQNLDLDSNGSFETPGSGVFVDATFGPDGVPTPPTICFPSSPAR